MTRREISRLMVANRGEIALRIMRTCHEMGIETVAVYGDGEEDAQHTRYATEAYRIPDGAGLPYLRIDALIEVARRAGADAIHPGYGFLAENTTFSQAVADAGLVFVGPPAHAMSLMGDKIAARRIALNANVPMVPGTTDPIESIEAAQAWADAHGYPVAVKASGGGGGKGFRVAKSASELPTAFNGSRGEAERYFSNPEVYLERYLEEPRHIEVQVFVDSSGKVWAFPERECSIQRRHQKLVEESPSPAVTEEIRERLWASTIALVQEVGYLGAGTVEYMLDTDGQFYFLEMNTRIQVEHTITEMVTGVDLVREQILAAQGDPPSFTQAEVYPRGWAIECRINAEDPGRDFSPSAGTPTRYVTPSGFGVRVESSILQGDPIMATYDSLISKLIAWGRSREEAIARMERALDDYVIDGVATTIPFHKKIMRHEAYRAGETPTVFLQRHPEVLDVAPAAVAGANEDEDAQPPLRMLVEVGGRRLDVAVSGLSGMAPIASNGGTGRAGTAPRRKSRAGRASERKAGGNDLVAPGQGTVLRVAAKNGQVVKTGDLICVLEAMKMENDIVAHRDGVVANLSVTDGASVAAGTVLATIEDAPEGGSEG
jgi:acetyl-CoA/propionyl-CoA carboxylase, biotin carboxylase, biotin carboxyl carrier protein